ncbi:Uncharacterised protein [Enterobacter cancerogenus]|uniref:Uncharacterized protein n=1 Tax=Enterobacter cancerogenus TaxID=69218 RepID=A0A484YMN2_9ENTR|nr:Uncharacterised protein [Enterobacter cancerogenus]
MAVELARCRGCARFRRRDQLVNASRFLQQLWVLLEVNFNVVDRITGTGDFVAGGIHVYHETCRGHANQDQHHQTNAFLTVVRTV